MDKGRFKPIPRVTFTEMMFLSGFISAYLGIDDFACYLINTCRIEWSDSGVRGNDLYCTGTRGASVTWVHINLQKQDL